LLLKFVSLVSPHHIAQVIMTALVVCACISSLRFTHCDVNSRISESHDPVNAFVVYRQFGSLTITSDRVSRTDVFDQYKSIFDYEFPWIRWNLSVSFPSRNECTKIVADAFSLSLFPFLFLSFRFARFSFLTLSNFHHIA